MFFQKTIWEYKILTVAVVHISFLLSLHLVLPAPGVAEYMLALRMTLYFALFTCDKQEPEVAHAAPLFVAPPGVN